jgi:hypothetical protein
MARGCNRAGAQAPGGRVGRRAALAAGKQRGGRDVGLCTRETQRLRGTEGAGRI